MSTLSRSLSALVVTSLTLAAGCAAEELQGNLFDVRLQGAENTCTGGGPSYDQRLTYRVVFDGLDIIMAVDGDEWATGEIDGCRLTYESIVWSSLREGYEIKWRIYGEAEVDQSGGSGCIEEPDIDWLGTETFTILGSAHPSVDPGCTYTLDVTGRFAGLAAQPEETDGTSVIQ